MYDNICKFLAETFPSDLAQWLLGETLELTKLEPTELQVEPIRADSLIFLQSENIILHIEFQTVPDRDIPFRMADYRLRLHRLYPDKQVYQVVIYLKKTNSSLVYQTTFALSEIQHRFNVIRLWEVPAEQLLESSGLLPFAVLSQTENRENILQEVARKIEAVSDNTRKSDLTASTAILAGLVFDKIVINRVLRQEIMKESVIYQEIQAEAEARGRQQGRQEGRQQGRLEGRQEGRLEGRQEGRLEGRLEGEANLVIKLLTRRIGQVSEELNHQIRSLSVEQLENLGEALLDFQTTSDLINWLDTIN